MKGNLSYQLKQSRRNIWSGAKARLIFKTYLPCMKKFENTDEIYLKKLVTYLGRPINKHLKVGIKDEDIERTHRIGK